MADQNSGSAAGCTLILVVLALAFWPVVLTALAVGGLLGLIVYGAAAQRFQQLRGITLAAQRRFAGDVCLVEGRYGELRQIELQGPPTQPLIVVWAAVMTDGSDGPELTTSTWRLPPPADLRTLRSNAGVARFLEDHGLAMVGDLAVEAKATRAALECLREVAWTRQALETLQQLNRSAAVTLAKAQGNELLEPSIPQLQEALAAFAREEHKLEEALAESRTMLRKLHDFLGVPAGIRPILSFDLDQLFDPQRLRELEQSFDEVVQLNDAFRELSRQKLA